MSRNSSNQEEQALRDLLKFPFVDALFGRRSRRFFRGAEIPDGPLAYKSRHDPLPLTELERLLILTYDTFGKFPATVPTIFILMYLQTHHLDLEYYDKLFNPGAYLYTHAEHLSRWHGMTG